jgi:aldehyde reductase
MSATVPAIAPTKTLNNGYEMPVLGLGTWQGDKGTVGAAVETAILNGYRAIDAAAIYKNEVEVGEGIARALAQTDLKRSDLFITSKLWNDKHAPEDVESACRQTIADLGVEYLDLYLIHWPMSDVDHKVCYAAMEQLVDLGLVRSLGICNYNHVQLGPILAAARIKPVMLQIECNPRITQKPLIEFARENKMEVTAYSPLGSPGSSWVDLPSLLNDAKIQAIAEKYGKNAGQILIRFAVERGLFVIPKSTTPSRIISNGNVFDFSLTAEEVETLESFNCGFRVCNFARDHPEYPFNEEY